MYVSEATRCKKVGYLRVKNGKNLEKGVQSHRNKYKLESTCEYQMS